MENPTIWHLVKFIPWIPLAFAELTSSFPFCSYSYYVRAQETSLHEFYQAKVLDTLLQELKDADTVINKISPSLPRWLGETSSASGGGAEGISDRFIAGFM